MADEQQQQRKKPPHRKVVPIPPGEQEIEVTFDMGGADERTTLPQRIDVSIPPAVVEGVEVTVYIGEYVSVKKPPHPPIS
jgi:hypothetical protein